MDVDTRWMTAIFHFAQRHFFQLLIASYALAAVFPGPGLWMRDICFGQIPFFASTKLSLPLCMLALLLLTAGLGVQTSRLRHLLRSPLVLVSGLLANLLVPIALIFGATLGMRLWHNPDEVQTILVGLALVASMPIAGSSTAWAQHANGNLALSLGLVLFSTFLSPWTTPIALHSVGLMATGDYAEDLHELAAGGMGGFLALAVLLPSVLGLVLHGAIGESRIASRKPFLKLINSANLLLLNYSNASVSLPQAVADPDWDFLAITLAIVVGLCGLAFASGWLIGRLVRADASQRAALMFGLGMNNNGTGLVLASLSLAEHPRVLLPIVVYNLVQHLVAGGVDFVLTHAFSKRFCSNPESGDRSKQG